MSSKLTAETFLMTVKKSGLVEKEQLKKFWQGYKQAGHPVDDLKSIADELVNENFVTRWQVEKLLAAKHKGFFLGKYRLLSHLGTGGMSSVYLAEHVVMKRQVAIKVLPQAAVTNTSYLERFHREAQAVGTLDHPNIVRAYDIDVENGIHFIVMEYVNGRSLQDMVYANGPMDFVEFADKIRQAAEGLAHAHQSGMVHRDIKPGNFLVDNRGVVKLLDLGLAMFFDDPDENPLTIRHDEKVLGTADYLSPEQALDSHTVDARADVYSLGCTSYFLLTGHPPFPDGTLTQRLLAHQTKMPAPLETERVDIPASLAAIVNKMMQKKRDDRYQTAKEVALALTDWLIENGGEEWRERNPYLAASVSDSFKMTAAQQIAASGSGIQGSRAGGAAVAAQATAAAVKSPRTSDTDSVARPTKVPLSRKTEPGSQANTQSGSNSSKIQRGASAEAASNSIATNSSVIRSKSAVLLRQTSRPFRWLGNAAWTHKTTIRIMILAAISAVLAWLACNWLATSNVPQSIPAPTSIRSANDGAFSDQLSALSKD